MADYSLDRDEAVILKNDRVHYAVNSRSNDSFELVLTSRKLVLIRVRPKLFGTTRDIAVYPIKQIKVFNGQAQAVLSGKTIEVYFYAGPERFGFADKKDAAKWISHINLLATGRENEIQLNQRINYALPGADYVSGALKDTIDVFKNRFAEETGPPVKVTERCDHCGASIDGYKGRATACSYCGTTRQMGEPTPPVPVARSAASPAPVVSPVVIPSPVMAPAPVMATAPVMTPAPVRPPAPVIAPRPAAYPAVPAAVRAPVSNPAFAPGWKPDPKALHRFRWWDGWAWTADVFHNGRRIYDPL